MEGREAPRYRLTKRGKLAFPWQHLIIDTARQQVRGNLLLVIKQAVNILYILLINIVICKSDLAIQRDVSGQSTSAVNLGS